MSEYDRRRHRLRQLDPAYREEARRRTAEWYRANTERARDYKLKRRFGLSAEEYEARLARQGGLCAICRQPETAEKSGTPIRLAVDHDHETGAVRGLLCTRCNRAIGYFRESPSLVAMAIGYLSPWRPSAEEALA